MSDRGLALGAVGEASIVFGRGITSAQPGSIDRLVLAVYDIDAARGELLSHGVAVSEVFHDAILLCAHPKSDFELFEPAAHHRVMHSQMIWRVQALPPLRGACPELGRTVKSFQLFNRRRSVQTVQPVEGFQQFKSIRSSFTFIPS